VPMVICEAKLQPYILAAFRPQRYLPQSVLGVHKPILSIRDIAGRDPEIKVGLLTFELVRD